MNIKDKFKIFQGLEIIVWVIILSVAIVSIKNYNYQKHKQLKRYQIFLPDVDGLISGSPVRMMGVNIGYVEDVNIVRDEVYVKFVLTQEDVTLPKGVIATVEFNGMAGSKSLELYPPTQTSIASNRLIVPQSPKRLNSALGLLCDMFNQLGSMMQKASNFSDEMGEYLPNQPKEINLEENSVKINGINKFLEDLNIKRKDFMKKTKERIKNEPEQN